MATTRTTTSAFERAHGCNTAIGYLGDSLVLLRTAVAYLELHTDQTESENHHNG